MKIVIIFSIIISFSLGCVSQIAFSRTKQEDNFPQFVSSNERPFSCECDIKQSQIFAELVGDNCENSSFELINPDQSIELLNSKIFLVHSFSELQLLKIRHIKADLIDNIMPQDFDEHIYAFVFIHVTYGKAIKNTAVIKKGNGLAFSYEEWRIRSPEIFCFWTNLYILKLKKSGL